MYINNIRDVLYAAGAIYLVLAIALRFIYWVKYKAYFKESCKKGHYKPYVHLCENRECKYRKICSVWKGNHTLEKINELKKLAEKLAEQYKNEYQGIQK